MAFSETADQPAGNAAAQANSPAKIETPAASDATASPVVRPPSHESGPPEKIWTEYFRENQPAERVIAATVWRLFEKKEHEHVIHLIQAALLNGQSYPWMYETLATSMQIVGRPKADVQRVVLSLTDFGAANIDSMLYSGAYLTRLGREETALRLYRQASRMQPERPEPYLLGLRLSRKLKQPADVEWSAVGVLKHAWTASYERDHREAENAALEAEEWYAAAGQQVAADRLKQAVAEAKIRDLRITLTWNGSADLDLLVEEPGGTVCLFESPETIGGGMHLHDGYGPAADNCIETYLCPEGVSGEYRIRVRHVFGEVVGGRAQVTIARHIGTEQEQTTRQTIVLTGDDAVLRVTLDDGRRQKLRTVSTLHLDPERARQTALTAQLFRRQGELTAEEATALRRFQEGRELSHQQILSQAIQNQTARPFVTGAVGFQPVVSLLNEGSSLTANAVVSPDRRYVRIAVNPVFSTLTDVFTFSFVSGVDPFGGRNTGLGN